MARISLSSVVTGSFVNRFRGLAGSSNNGNSFTDALRGGASSTSISNGLRFGAQTFSNAVQTLNSSISVLNLASNSLDKLGKFTDKLIDVTERAASASTSEDTRNQLSVEFQKIAGEFEQVVSNAQLGDTNYLTKEGLVAIFKKVGLSEKDSQSMAAVLGQFITPATDDTLASEYVKSSRPIDIGPGAYTTQASDTAYQVRRITPASGLERGQGWISAVNSVFAKTDNILNQNPGYRTIFTSDSNGTLQSLHAGSISVLTNIVTVNETTGYSVIASSEDLFNNQNPSLRNQLFLVNSTGEIVAQVTNNSSAGISFGSVDMSADNLTVLYAQSNGLANTLKIVTSPALGTDPSTLTHTTIDSSGVNDFTKVALNNAGTYLAYDKGGFVQFMDTATFTTDAYFATVDVAGGGLDFGFFSSSTLGFYSGDKKIKDYNYGGGAGGVGILESDVETATSRLAFLERDDTYNGHGYYSYVDISGYLNTSERTHPGTRELQNSVLLPIGAAGGISSMSMAYRSDGKADVGIVGTLSDRGDVTSQLYRISYNPQSSAGQQFSRASSESNTIFESDITHRADAYRTLADLKELKKQIEGNQKALKNVQEVVAENISLVRASGLAFLDLSQQISNSDDADKVASKLQLLIRSNAGAAISQAENLNAIVVATLTLSN